MSDELEIYDSAFWNFSWTFKERELINDALKESERRGRVEELKNILKLDIDEREFEGFKVIEYCRERLLELEKGDLR